MHAKFLNTKGLAKYIEDYSLNEISKKLNQPINTIKIKIFRAKKILNKLIED